MSNEHPTFRPEELDASDLRCSVVVSRFNQRITDLLLDGALTALGECGARQDEIEVVSVPGALEIGTAAEALIRNRQPDLMVCLGCVIRGGTAHFDFVCREAMRAIGAIARRGDIAIGNGLLTVDTIVQAQERVGGSHGHKGREAALTAVEVAHTLRRIRGL